MVRKNKAGFFKWKREIVGSEKRLESFEGGQFHVDVADASTNCVDKNRKTLLFWV